MSSIFAVMASTFAGMFAVIALILAATGIYGVVAYRTQLRTHEIGIRVALGASRADVLRLVLMQGVRLTVVGLVAGTVAGLRPDALYRGYAVRRQRDRSDDGGRGGRDAWVDCGAGLLFPCAPGNGSRPGVRDPSAVSQCQERFCAPGFAFGGPERAGDLPSCKGEDSPTPGEDAKRQATCCRGWRAE